MGSSGSARPAGPSPLVRVAGPVDLAGSLDVFLRSGDDLLDRWDGQVWLRAVAVDGRMIGTAARPVGTVADPGLLIEIETGARAAGEASSDPAPSSASSDPAAGAAFSDPASGAAFSDPAAGSVPRWGSVAETGVGRSGLSTATAESKPGVGGTGPSTAAPGSKPGVGRPGPSTAAAESGTEAGAGTRTGAGVGTGARALADAAAAGWAQAGAGAGASVDIRAAAGRALAGAFVTAPEALAELAAADPVVARIAARFPGVGPVLQPDLLTAVTRSISAQQITLRFAAVLRGRLARRYGRRHEVRVPSPAGPAGRPLSEVWSLDPERLAGAAVADLRELQFSTSKATAIVAFAGAVVAGRVSLQELAGLPDEEVVARLVVFPGVGRWTAEWLLARTLGRPRVVAGDLGVRKAVGAAYLDGRMPSDAEVRAVTANWGPAAGVAQQLLLHWRSVEEPAGARRAPTGSRSATRPARSSPRG
jgi:DNA-3-methyladenine glycosylase II